MPRIEDALQGLGVGSLAEIPLLSKLTLAVLARVRSRSGFLGHAKSILFKDIQSNPYTKGDRARARLLSQDYDDGVSYFHAGAGGNKIK